MFRRHEHNLGILCWLSALGLARATYSAVPRWGQAVALVNDAFFVFGGKTDQYNQYSYTSAPWNNDLLFLSLSSSFDPASPPWQYVSGSQNSSTSNGPSLAWHTLSAVNTSYALVFGGNTGPLSQQVLLDESDSALLLDMYNRLAPNWIDESESWASEPQRRMRHSASSTGGKIWIVGGERADGSTNGFSDHYVFDPSVPSFTQLPSANSPPDIYGHVSIVLQDGRLIVFGGFSQSQGRLIPFDTVWALDTTQSTLVWTTIQVDTSSLPNARMAFAAVILDDGRVLIHGGTDSGFQDNLSDGWILETSKSPMVWSAVSALAALGGRRDHFAICVGSQVIFGFGYGSAGPADANLHVFDVDSGNFSSSFTPITTGPVHQTLPTPTPTNGGSSSQTGTAGLPGHTGSSTSNSSGTKGHGSASSTGAASSPSNTQSGGNDGNGDSDADPDSSKNKKTAAIAVGSILGLLGFVVGTAAAIYYVRRRVHQRPEDFSPLGNDEDDEESPHDITAIAMVGGHEKGRSAFPVFLGAVGLGRARQAVTRERRDMLADEDKSFGSSQWRHVSREGSGSSWSGTGTTSRRSSQARTLTDVVTGSLASLRAIGRRGTRSREPTQTSLEWNEKDPFSDEIGLMAGGFADDGLPDRLRGGSTSMPAGMTGPYTDPFEDAEVLHDAGSDSDLEQGEHHRPAPGVALKPPHPSLRTALLPIPDFVPMSPLMEQASHNSLSGSSSSHLLSSGYVESSRTSQDPSPRSPRPTSVIDANAPPSLPIRRSDSWWARFARTPLRLSGSADAASANHPSRSSLLEFRDPNPPPRLITIEESQHSNLSDSPGSKYAHEGANSAGQGDGGGGDGGGVSRRASRSAVYASLGHGKSVSSLQTANTETLERAEGTMAIIQRDGTMDSQLTTSPIAGDDFGQGEPIAGPSTRRLLLVRQISQAASESSRASTPLTPPASEGVPVDADARDRSGERSSTFEPSLPAADPTFPRLPPRRLSSTGAGAGAVSARIKAFERRLSRDAEGPPPPTNTRKREERSGPRPVVRYTLVPKPSLFVANPDRRDYSSSDTL